MAKFYGKIGYVETEETVIGSGVWHETIVERTYFGDLRRYMYRSQASDKVNDEINIRNEISIIADEYANINFSHMRYVEFMGAKWKIISADVQYPRINLSIGGVYNG